MLDAFYIGLLAASSVVIGGIIASRFSLSNPTSRIIMGFGAKTLISAISYELIFEALQIAKRTGLPAYGFFFWCFDIFFSDMLIQKYGSVTQIFAGVIETNMKEGIL